MNRIDERLREAWRDAASPRSRTACLSGESLSELVFEGGRDQTLVEHIATCAACAEEVLAVRGAAERAGQLSRPPVPAASSTMSDMAIAALIVLTLGLGGWSFVQLNRTAELEQRVAALQHSAQQPVPVRAEPIAANPVVPRVHPNVPIIDLEPGGDATRSRGVSDTVRFPAADAYTLVMTIDPAPRHERYELAVVDDRGEVVFSVNDLRRSEHDTFTLGFEKALLKPGIHRVEIFGSDGSERTKLESYSILIP